jgi:hypothetical protein
MMGIAHEVRTSTGRGPSGLVNLKETYAVKFSSEVTPNKVSQAEADAENAKLAEAVFCAAFGLNVGEYNS